MPKRSRRVPRYLSEDPAWREAESRRQFGIPRDAIPADPEQQVPQDCPCPPRFYTDYTYMCEDCGREQMWTAEQQRWWYEVAKGRMALRSRKALGRNDLQSIRNKHAANS